MHILLNSYNDINFVMQLEASTGIKLIMKCYTDKRKELQEKVWLSVYPAMIHSYGNCEKPLLEFKSIEDMFKHDTEKTEVETKTETKKEKTHVQLMLEQQKLMSSFEKR